MITYLFLFFAEKRFILEIVVIPIVVCLGAILTFFSGFGLGTLMLPAFGLFFPLEVAIGATAIVHLTNNVFKMSLLYKDIDKEVLWRFGIPAILAAFLGSYILVYLGSIPTLFSYSLYGKTYEISPIKLSIGVIMISFAILELFPVKGKLALSKKHFILGGLLSGFFGGISGHQGALRSMFLSKTSRSKEAFLATSGCIGLFIDIARLSVYSQQMNADLISNQGSIILLAMVFAFAGTWIGKRLLKKTTMTGIQRMVGILLVVFGLLLALGIT
jgi:uncharacterized membrane protein YfcA